MNEARLHAVQKNLQKLGLTQALITNPFSIKYLTGYFVQPFERFFALYIPASSQRSQNSPSSATVDAGASAGTGAEAHAGAGAQPGADTPVLFVNAMFPDASSYAPRTIVLSDTESPLEALCSVCNPNEKLGVDETLLARWLVPLQHAHAAADYVLASSAVSEARGHKLPDEQEKMRAASALNDECMAWLMDQIHEGVQENELAAALLKKYEAVGASGPSFDPLISFGANAADPHHEPDSTKLKPGDCILCDIGCILDDYCSDMTRTAFYGEPSQEFLRAYQTVLAANRAAENLIKPGVSFAALDRAARGTIEEAGYGQFFTHRLGHSIGLEEHEPGDVSSAHDAPVEPGNIFSIEPGIYIPEKFGIRIEDLVLVTEDGCEILNHYPKELKIFA